MNVLVTVLLGVFVVVAAVLAIAACKPNDFHIQRAISVQAPSTRIFELINDLHAWPAWSPWAKLDPQMKTTYSGPKQGVGAGYSWSGNGKVGEGSMRIRESVPASKVLLELKFLKPFKASNQCVFSLQPTGDTTRVIWAMDGKNLFMSKVMGLFINMDKFIGKDFERGLESLKQVAEG